jgi:hypothetical protein
MKLNTNNLNLITNNTPQITKIPSNQSSSELSPNNNRTNINHTSLDQIQVKDQQEEPIGCRLLKYLSAWEEIGAL